MGKCSPVVSIYRRRAPLNTATARTGMALRFSAIVAIICCTAYSPATSFPRIWIVVTFSRPVVILCMVWVTSVVRRYVRPVFFEVPLHVSISECVSTEEGETDR